MIGSFFVRKTKIKVMRKNTVVIIGNGFDLLVVLFINSSFKT